MKRSQQLLAKLNANTITEEEKKELTTLIEKQDDGSDTEVVEISDEVVEKLTNSIEVIVDKKLEALEGIKETKKLGEDARVIVEDADAKMPGKRLFAKQLLAMSRGNNSELGRLNAIAMKGLSVELKSNYQNETTGADGAYLVPPADFFADVARLDGVYGVALRDADVREINSNSAIFNRKSGGVSFTETGEGVAKTGTKMTFGQDTVALRKFAAIAPFTDELDEDGAVSIYDELVRDFALARNKKADELVFTDTTYGVTNVSGVKTTTFGAAFSNIDFDDLSVMISQLGQTARQGAKFYISAAVEAQLRVAKVATTYAWNPASQGQPGTIWGYPYELVDVLPTDFATNEAYAVFGNLKWIKLVVKRGLDITLLTEGTIHDAGNAAINLAEQDMKAVRAVTRMNARVQFPTAFSVGGTGNVS